MNVFETSLNAVDAILNKMSAEDLQAFDKQFDQYNYEGETFGNYIDKWSISQMQEFLSFKQQFSGMDFDGAPPPSYKNSISENKPRNCSGLIYFM